MSVEIQKDISLAEFTTFRIGGKARFLARAASETEVVEALDFADRNSLNVFILGGGSNVLASDEGFDGLVLQIALKGVSICPQPNGTVLVTAQAGEDWDDFVAFCVNKNLAGIECLSGIPGFVGGTPVQNVGAYGQEVSEAITSVKVFNRQTKSLKNLTAADCGFSYRTSIFNSTDKNRYVVLAVTYALTLNGKPKVEYADLRKYFTNETPDLIKVRRAVCEIRASKAMLVRQDGADAQSAGSFFKNPVVSPKQYTEILKKAREIGFGNVPQYKIDEQHYKIAAAWLIENAGFQKGFTKGNAGLSTKHTLALTNRGGASAAEILNLMSDIQTRVEEIFGILLLPEPVFVGFT